MPMDERDHDYDLRQLALLEAQLSQFESGQIQLAYLIRGLDALLNCLRTVDQGWKGTFKSEWWTLEQVYAVALDRKTNPLSPENLPMVNGAVQALKRLVAEQRQDRKS